MKNWFSILLLLIVSAGHSQTPKASASLDTNFILVGDHMALNLKVECPSGYTVKWPSLLDSLTEKIEIIETGKIDTLFSEDKKKVTYSQKLTITAFDSGSYLVPSIEFLLLQKGDTTGTPLLTLPLSMNVQTVPVDTTKAFKDIKDIAGAPLSFSEIMEYVLWGLGALLLIGISIYVVQRIRKKLPIISLPSKPKRPAHEVALENFEMLRQKKLWQQGFIKEYQSELTDILRIYLSDRYQINALEMVSDEIIEALKTKQLKPFQIEPLVQIFQLADAVKFAKANPLPSEHDLSLSMAVSFVDATKPMEQNPNEKEISEKNNTSVS